MLDISSTEFYFRFPAFAVIVLWDTLFGNGKICLCTFLGLKYFVVLYCLQRCPFSFRQEALLAAISEKDANIALLELSSSKKKKTQEEVTSLKREKDRLVQQLKQQVSFCLYCDPEVVQRNYIFQPW